MMFPSVPKTNMMPYNKSENSLKNMKVVKISLAEL